MKCPKCRSKMVEKHDSTPEGIKYSYNSCEKCGEELVNMAQLQEVAQKYRKIKQYKAKVSKWGDSLAMRIPAELAKKYGIKQNEEVTLIPEKKAIKIVT